MAEIVRTGYQRLFEVRVLHHYFLDEGIQDFTTLAPDEQERRLLSGYDVRQFLSFQPTLSTQKMIGGMHGVFKSTPLGFVVAVPADAKVPGDARFEVFATVESADFMNYTSLTLSRPKIVEIQHGGQIFRYKELALLLGNSNGVKKTVSGTDLLCLSTTIPAFVSGPVYPVESFVLDGAVLYQADRDTAQAPPADWNALGTLPRPVYVHQDDAPLLTLPDGSTLRGIELTNELPDDIFALIRIDVMPADTDFQILSGGIPKTPAPVFEIHFKNRSTFWRYVNPPDQQYLPLTIYGNPGPSKPVTGGGTVKRKKATPSMLTIAPNRQLFSDNIE